MRTTKHRWQKLMGEINVTPFVDVMLVLLIIFMVTAPMLQRGVDIQLPQEAAGKVDLSKGAVISIKKNKKIYLGKEMIPLDKLEKRLKDLYAKRKLREVFLRADKNLPYGFVVKAMAKIKNAGIQRLGMVTEFIE
ncbi:MAG: ExbD/TolR family protein [Nitrospinota bacterium]|nr:ExbD/TolR family protein [Nitrospinota bacterium]